MPAPEERRRLGTGKGEAGAGSGGGWCREVPLRRCQEGRRRPMAVMPSPYERCGDTRARVDGLRIR